VCAALVVAGHHALADERMPSTLDCPDGADPQSIHGPAECIPSECSDDGGCKSGYTCVERALCVEARFGGKVATKSCSGGGACAYPTFCESKKRCVKQSSAAKLRQSCGCALVGGRHEPLLALVAAATAVAALVRRRAHCSARRCDGYHTARRAHCSARKTRR
jgi:hypothetical protein